MSERKVEYTIYIKAADGVQGTNEQSTPDTALGSGGSDISQKNKQSAADKQKNKAFKTGIAAYHYAKQIVAPLVANQVNTVSLRTGNDELQRRTQFGLDIASTAVDVAEFALTGAVLGGGVVGAAVGTAVGVASKLISYQTAYANQQLAKTVESVGLAEARIRAGTSGDRIGKSY